MGCRMPRAVDATNSEQAADGQLDDRKRLGHAQGGDGPLMRAALSRVPWAVSVMVNVFASLSASGVVVSMCVRSSLPSLGMT
jgi:hypothetical protein